jgi:uncharacterized protein YehS (DUF1456 family)
MDNNDILRRLRYILNTNDEGMCRILEQGNYRLEKTDMESMLRREEEEGFLPCREEVLGRFLDGLILEKRGPSDKDAPKQRIKLDNNLILKKLRIAFNLREEEMIAVFEKADFPISKHELSALFRKPGSRQYRTCKDQLLRKFLTGLAQDQSGQGAARQR